MCSDSDSRLCHRYQSARPLVHQQRNESLLRAPFTSHNVLWINRTNMSTPSTQPASETKITGVRINCIGDRRMRRPDYEEVEISPDDYVFTVRETSDIADRVGFPIFTREYPADPAWSTEPVHGIDFTNDDALWLYLCCDPSDPGWGSTPRNWDDEMGSVLVVRQDKKPLHTEHVEALCTYCSDLRLFFGHPIRQGLTIAPMSKDAVLAMIHRPAFEAHWFKMGYEGRSARVARVPSPYE